MSNLPYVVAFLRMACNTTNMNSEYILNDTRRGGGKASLAQGPLKTRCSTGTRKFGGERKSLEAKSAPANAESTSG